MCISFQIIIKRQYSSNGEHDFLNGCVWAGCIAGVDLFIWVWDCAFDICFFEFWLFSVIIFE